MKEMPSTDHLPLFSIHDFTMDSSDQKAISMFRVLLSAVVGLE